MRQLVLLVKIGMMEQIKWRELKNSKDRKKKMNTVLLLISFALLGAILVLYSAGGAYGLVYCGAGNLIPAASLVAVSTMNIFFTVLKTNGILFGYKDYDMLASLPIRTNILVSSRFLQLYGTNLLMSILIMLPMGVVYGIFQKEGLLFYIMWFIGTFLAPLIPTTIAAVIGTLIMAVSSRMRHANVVSAVLSILFVVVLLAGSSMLGVMNQDVGDFDIAAMADMAKKSMEKIYPVCILFAKGVLEKNIIAFISFVGVSVIWYSLFLAVVSRGYKHIQSMLTAHTTRRKFSGQFDFQCRAPIDAFVRKEWRRFLSSNMYLLNMGLGVVMMLLFAAIVCFMPQQKVQELIFSGDLSFDIQAMGMKIFPFLLSGMLGICCTTACSLSLEGTNIESLKALPLKPGEIYKGKIIMNLSLTIPAVLVTAFLIGIKYGSGILDILLLFLIPLSYSGFTAVWGMYLNIRMPNFSWENETIVVKQSMPVFLGIFGIILLALAGGVLVCIVPSEYGRAAMFLVAAIVAALSGVLYQLVKKSPLP